jgi:hypothetical protein
MRTVAVGASIALFMLLAAFVTPDPPPGGVGLRGAVRPALGMAALAGGPAACPGPVVAVPSSAAAPGRGE